MIYVLPFPYGKFMANMVWNERRQIKKMRIVRLIILIGAGFLATQQAMPQSASDYDIREWTVPWPGTRPRDPFVQSGAPSGDAIWFVGQGGDYLGRLTPSTGEMIRVEIEPGTGPHNLIVGDDGRVWFAGNLKSYIGIYDPATDAITKIAMPDTAARDPHTLIFDARGDIWFTVQGGNFIGHLDTTTLDIELIAVPTARARPYGIIEAPNGVIWSALFGTSKLASIDPATMTLTEHQLPRPNARPRRLAATSDGKIWYVDFAEGQLGVLDPTSNTITEWPMPSGCRARPYGMEVDVSDQIWFVETGPSPNLFVGFDTASEEFLGSAAIPSGAGSVRHMNYHQPTGTVWFGTDANTIGRARVE